MQISRDNPILSVVVNISNALAHMFLLVAMYKYGLSNHQNAPTTFTNPLICCHLAGSVTYVPLWFLSSYLPGTIIRLAFTVRRVLLMVSYLFSLLTLLYNIPWYIVTALIVPHMVGDFLIGLMVIRGKEVILLDAIRGEVKVLLHSILSITKILIENHEEGTFNVIVGCEHSNVSGQESVVVSPKSPASVPRTLTGKNPRTFQLA